MHIFEITIQRKTENIFPVVTEYYQSGGSLPIRNEGEFRFDEEKKRELTALEQNMKGYGTLIGEMLFCDIIRDAFMQARTESRGNLRILLVIEDPELKSLHWERLCGPIRAEKEWDFLSLDQQSLFSLYLPSLTERRFPAIGRRDLKALVVIASPQEENKYNLAYFHPEATIRGVCKSFGNIPYNILANIKGEKIIGPPTLDALCESVTGGSYTIMHIVAHGWFNKNKGETILYLLDSKGDVAPVTGSRLLERLDRLQGARGLPHFTFLCTCESAMPEAEASGSLGGLGQRLVRELGMPAVLAMTQKVSIQTADALASDFYKRLQEHGEPDRALAQSCAALADSGDITVPALYSRLGGRPLFSDTEDRELTDSEIDFGLKQMERLLPVHAPVLTDEYSKLSESLRRHLGVSRNAMSDAACDEFCQTMDKVNHICEEATELNFRAIALGQNPPVYDKRCPFPGLCAFKETDRIFFFGRDPLVRQLTERLEKQNFLAVLGASGSGKSSLVLAGVVPAFREKHPEFQALYMTPDNNPIFKIDALIPRQSSTEDKHLLLIIDQFEEIFTLCTNTDERRGFAERIIALGREQKNIKVIITMRADFWGDCALFPELKAIIQIYQELIAPMNSAELRRAMEQQAIRVGLRFEADLSHTILAEVQNEPGAMPLLQHLLQELWKRRHGRWLRSAEYHAIGGIHQAIAHTAEELYSQFTEKEKTYMQNIFIRLTRLAENSCGSGIHELRDTRERVKMSDLVPAGEDAEIVKRIIKRLADARLVVTSRDIEV